MPAKLGILAGAGALPATILVAAEEAGRDVFLLAFEGETDPALTAGRAHAWVPLGAVGRTIRHLHDAAVEEVVMIGAIKRPSLKGLKLDFRGMQLLTRIGLGGSGAASGQGDDRVLALLVQELEREGFRVVGADELQGTLLAAEGLIAGPAPLPAAMADIALGMEVAARLGALDIGQAVVVQQGVVLALEAAEGTDGLLERVIALKREGPGGVLVKLKKPLQDRRADLPTIGPDTVAGAHRAGLEGIAVQAGESLIVARGSVAEEAGRAGLFVIGVMPPA